MKMLTFKVIHRLLLRNMVDEAGKNGGSLSEIRKMLNLLEKVVFSEEEVKKFGIRVEDGNIKWNLVDENKKSIEDKKEIEFSDEQIDLIKDIIKKKDEKKEFTMADVSPVTEMAGMVGYELK